MSTLGVMHFGCPTCHRVRPVTLDLSPKSIRDALDRPCVKCSVRSRPYGKPTQIDTATYLADEIAFIGECPEIAAKRLGTTPEALARRFYRVGMVDLARQFQAVATRKRYARRKAAA